MSHCWPKAKLSTGEDFGSVEKLLMDIVNHLLLWSNNNYYDFVGTAFNPDFNDKTYE